MDFKKSEKVIIIGGSHGAVAAVQVLQNRGYRGRIVLVSEEEVPLFSPTALPYLFWQKTKNARTLRSAEFFRDIEVIHDRATLIDVEKSRLSLRSGKKIHYDRLVIATGASAAQLPIQDCKTNHLLTLRRIEDVKRIEQKAARSRSVLIIGAGLIGLHLAQVFTERGKEVHVIELAEQILPGLVHSDLSHFLKQLLEEKGIRISLGTSLAGLNDKEAVLSDGGKISSEVNICAIGIKPNLEVIQDTRISRNKGIVVDACMQTNVPGVYACGDVAEFSDFFTGESRLNPNVISAAEQGRTAAESIASKNNPHPGLISINVCHILGSILFSLGKISPDPGDMMIEDYDATAKVFKRMIFHDGLLQGAVLFNTPIDGGLYYRFLRERISLAGMEDKLLSEPLLWGKKIAERVFKD